VAFWENCWNNPFRFFQRDRNAIAIMKARKAQKQDRDLTRRVHETRRQRALSYDDLGKKAGYSERTVRNFISGKATRPKTRRDICEALGLEVGKKFIAAADEAHGQYTRDQVRDYVGLFFAFRRSFDVQQNLVRSIF
jgi:ribosome-binding protein aMBF1 (putative translation factor)